MKKVDNFRDIQRATRRSLPHGLLVLLGVVTICLIGCNRESDAKLVDIFERNKSDFQRLAIMAEQDRHLARIESTYTLPVRSSSALGATGLSQQRWDEYRQLFSKLGIKYGVDRREDFPSVVFLWADCDGSAISRDCKGYAYSERALSPIKDNLNDLAPGVFFRSLSKNWYLFRDGG